VEPILNGDEKTAVQKLLAALPEPPAGLTTTVSGKGTLIRFIEMPKMSPTDLKKSFALEADKYFPFPKDQIYTDCFILEKGDRDAKMSVLVAAAKKELVDQRIALFKELESVPDAMILDALALANAVYRIGAVDSSAPKDGAESAQEAVAVLDIGDRISNLVVMVDGFPRFCRDIFIGGHELTLGISNGLGVSIEEAEKMKRQPQDKLPDILKAADSVIMNLVSELRLSFDYFITEKNISIASLFLTGGASALEGLPGLFTKYLEMEVRKWPLMQGVSLSPAMAEETKADILKIADSLGVAVGLASYS